MKGFRTKIGIFGRINAGKSSLINALTNQDIAIVSDVPGTTTDPVSKSMELNQLPPVLKHFRQLPPEKPDKEFSAHQNSAHVI